MAECQICKKAAATPVSDLCEDCDAEVYELVLNPDLMAKRLVKLEHEIREDREKGLHSTPAFGSPPVRGKKYETDEDTVRSAVKATCKNPKCGQKINLTDLAPGIRVCPFCGHQIG